MKYFLTGLFLGWSFGTAAEMQKRIRLREALIDDMNLRTDLINWVVTEGVYLEAEEFWPIIKEKAAFINIVAVRSQP